MEITGVVTKGQGGASQIPEELLQERCQAAGVQLVRGTFNVTPHGVSLAGAIIALGTPEFECDRLNPRGPFRGWKVQIEREGYAPVDAFVVRHTRSGAPYLELMATVRLRDALGAEENGVQVVIRR